VSDFVVVLNSDDAVRAFASSGNVTIGGNLSAAVGPIGTGGSVDTFVPSLPSLKSSLAGRALMNPAPIFTYSKSKGLYAGVSLEGTVLVERVSGTSSWTTLV
jgi:lipid-binding SYLF domain-containing protein